MTPSFSLLLLLLLSLSQAHCTIEGTNEEDIEEEDTLDITDLILTTNDNINEILLEGDMVAPHTRNAMKCWSQNCLWPKGSDGLVNIPYSIGSDFTAEEKQFIQNAMKEFERRKTCIRFVSRSNEVDYIQVKNGKGCYSFLGRHGGAQVLSLKNWGCLYAGIVQHEFLHALGFQHEQTRSDRDDYVTINWRNIQSGKGHNFQKRDTNNLNTPYDYSSIMHYGRKAFTNNGGETITPIKDTSAHIGQRWAMSDWDVSRINILYECN